MSENEKQSNIVKLENQNKYQATHNDFFIKCCEHVSIPNTARQYSKYKRGLGLAYSVSNQVKRSEKKKQVLNEIFENDPLNILDIESEVK